MIRPRWLAWLLARTCGYFWIPCPVCRKPFAGFEAAQAGATVNHRVEDGEHVSECVCSRPACIAEGQRQQQAFFDRMRAQRAGRVIHLRP